MDAAGPLPLADGEVAVAFTCLVLGGIDGPVALAAMGAELERVLAPCGIVFLAESGLRPAPGRPLDVSLCRRLRGGPPLGRPAGDFPLR
jgi:hypothetical protein